eukprot:1673640-Pyramimonas_sp.AAC.1
MGPMPQAGARQPCSFNGIASAMLRCCLAPPTCPLPLSRPPRPRASEVILYLRDRGAPDLGGELGPPWETAGG